MGENIPDRNAARKRRYSGAALPPPGDGNTVPPMERIKILREQRGLTQEQLADAVGVKQAYISRIERGLSEPSLPVLRSVASVLQVNPGDLFDRQGLEARIQRAIDRLDDRRKLAAAAVLESMIPDGE